ncbi:MAG: ZIP family metal transporter [Candidatus Hadarchaeota archaeon]
MSELLWIIAGTTGISLISFTGALTLVISERLLDRLLHVLFGLAAGTLMGGAFLHLIPEALGNPQSGGTTTVFTVVIVGFAVFFVMERLIWRRCRERKCPIHTFAYLNLIGDGIHNFIDGLAIAASFLVDIRLGVVTTFAVAVHEIPQELGDFGVIVYGGLKPRKALLMNFATALTALVGGIVGFFFLPHFGGVIPLLLPFAAGSFLYIAASNLVPEMHKQQETSKTATSFVAFLFGAILLLALKFVFVE